MGELRSRLDELPRDRPIVVFCHVGVRSAHVAGVLKAEGFRGVSNLRGGYLAWLEDVDSTLTRY
jgi:rhodanese-related sulfurtransferase